MLDHTVHDQLEHNVNEEDEEDDDEISGTTRYGDFGQTGNATCEGRDNCTINDFWTYLENSGSENRETTVRISKIRRQ
jgi:hypothetical protein